MVKHIIKSATAVWSEDDGGGWLVEVAFLDDRPEEQHIPRKHFKRSTFPGVVLSDTLDWLNYTLPARYIVRAASANMPNSCWGTYGKVAVLELEPGFSGVPKMISEHARGVRSVVKLWDKVNVGKTEKCAYQKARKEAEELAAELNADLSHPAQDLDELNGRR
jgi:hypothetical protein